MNTTKGYYSLVQYCPDFARQEAANIGVVLFCPDQGFLKSEIATANHRVRRFFGDAADGYRHLNAMKDALANRLRIEAPEFRTLSDFDAFIGKRGNKVVLTQPKAIKVMDPEADLTALFQELVLEPMKPILPVETEEPLRRRLDRVFMDAEVLPYVRQNLRVEVPALKRPIEVPYGFQNGRFNLIRPVSFTQKFPTHVTRSACVHAVEGHSLYRYAHSELGQLQLVIVAEFSAAGTECADVVREILQEHDVRLIAAVDMDGLKQEIVTHGRVLAQG